MPKFPYTVTCTPVVNANTSITMGYSVANGNSVVVASGTMNFPAGTSALEVLRSAQSVVYSRVVEGLVAADLPVSFTFSVNPLTQKI